MFLLNFYLIFKKRPMTCKSTYLLKLQMFGNKSSSMAYEKSNK